MPAINHQLAARDGQVTDGGNPSVLKALIALAVITTVLLAGIATYALIKVARKRTAASKQSSKADNQWRRLTIETMGTTHTLQEKRSLMDSSSPPSSPLVPEIRITLPDEVDKTTGRPQSGRVVVVRMGENASVGLEPLMQAKQEEQLPAYEKIAGIGKFDFEELDLEKMGGLKEKGA
jgi:hypothetical protein